MLARALTVALLLAAVLAPSARAADPITPLRDVQRGMACTARTVVQGTEITSFDVEVLDVVAAGNGLGAFILVRVSGPAVERTGIASGFSGSPVYCPNAQGVLGNAGAISATVGEYGNDVALVTPIEDMLALPARPPAGVRHAPRLVRSARPVATPLVVAGLTPGVARVAERAARASGRPLVASPAIGAASFPPQQLVPGASLAAGISSGAIAMSAIGTVTYVDGIEVWGFGHPFLGVGRRSLLLQDAYVYTVVGNPNVDIISSYKLAAPGHTLGTLSNDALAGVVGTLGDPPRTTPVTVTVRDEDRGRTLQERTEVADEVDVGEPMGGGTLSTLASLGVAQAVSLAFDGAPARESGRMCLRATVREARRPLRFCNRYVMEGAGDGLGVAPIAGPMSADVAVALSAIEQARFAGLHVTGVAIGARVQRGLQLATIRSVRGPRRVKPGQRVRVAVRVRLDRGPLRTVRFKLRIPRSLKPGLRTIHLVGTPSDGGEGFYEVLFDLFEQVEDGGGAQTMREVAARFAATARYDGVTARAGKRRWRSFRHPRLRLDGRGELNVVVLGRGKAPRGLSIEELLKELLR